MTGQLKRKVDTYAPCLTSCPNSQKQPFCAQILEKIAHRFGAKTSLEIYITPRRGINLCPISGSLKDYTNTKPRAHPAIPPGTSIRQHLDSNLRQEFCHPCVGLGIAPTITDSKPETIHPKSIHLQEVFMMSSNKVVLSYRPEVNSEQPPSRGYRTWPFESQPGTDIHMYT